MMIANSKHLKNNSRQYSNWDFLAPTFSGSTGVIIGLILGSILGLI